jgi:hypothetical protein
VFVRTTIELPDELFRTLKARAALSGITFRELILRLIEQGLQNPAAQPPSRPTRRAPPPVAIPPIGVPIQALPRQELRRWEEADDEDKHVRSA